MGPSKKITHHLAKKNIAYEVVPHKKVFTAYDLAQTLGARLDQIAKTVLVHVDFPKMQKKSAQYFVVVLPASCRLNIDVLQKKLKAKKVRLMNEKAMALLRITAGMLTPFGSLRNCAVVLDKTLATTKQILVGAESFTDSLRMKTKDFIALEQPLVTKIGKKYVVRRTTRKI